MWDFTEVGRIDPQVIPPQKIQTIPHKAWQAQSFQILRALMGTVKEIIFNQIKCRILKLCNRPY